MEALMAANERAKEIYRRNLELLSQGKLPPCIKVIEAGQGRKLKRKRNNPPPPPPPTKKAKIKLVDLVEKEAPLIDLTSESEPDSRKEDKIEVINIE